MSTTSQFGKYTVELSKLDKIFFPESGITKGDLIEYHEKIADRMLPWFEDRPVSLQRFPDGIEKQGFYQKETPDYFPDWIDQVKVPLREGGSQQQVLVNKQASLIYIVNQGTITLHPWLSKADKLEHPDRLVFDLDPEGGDFDRVRKTALRLKEMFEELDLTPFVQTTGSKGLHVLAPLDRSADFDEVRNFAREMADLLAERHPEELTTEARKNKRKGRIYLDTARNAYAQTAVAPYSVRPRPGAPVAVPLDWDEVKDSGLRSDKYTIKNIFRRLGQQDDPYAGFFRHARSLKTPKKNLGKMKNEE